MLRAIFLIFICGLSAFACAAPAVQTASAPQAVEALSARAADIGSYRLDIGDRLRLMIFEEPDLSGEFTVDDGGSISLALAGSVKARGYTVSELETQIEEAYKQGFLRDPEVSIEVLRYRPYYISGEVENDGEYPYVVGMTIPQAVATAGGYTRRANKGKVVIIRAGTTERVTYEASQATLVFPGDVIEVPERFF